MIFGPKRDFVTLREKHVLNMSEDRVLRRIFGRKREDSGRRAEKINLGSS
jgi:hypothetical protein